MPSTAFVAPRRRRRAALLLGAAAAAVATASVARAGDVAQWVQPVSGDWFDATKWSTNPSTPGTGGVTAAVLGATGAAHTVTIAPSVLPTVVTLDSLTLASPDVTLRQVSGTVNVPSLVLSAGTYNLAGGTLAGTTIDTSGGGQFKLSSEGIFPPATLEQATLASNLSLGAGELSVTKGVNLNGHDLTILAAASGGNSTMTFTGAQTIAGSGRLLLGGTGGTATIYTRDALTVGAGVTLASAPGAATTNINAAQFTAGSVVNEGTIASDTAGRTLNVYCALTNNGIIRATAGGALTLSDVTNHGTVTVSGATVVLDRLRANDGTILLENADTRAGDMTTAVLNTLTRSGGTLTISRTLDNTGATLDVDHTGPLKVTGTILGGTIQSTDADALQPSGGGTAKLQGVTIGSTLRFTDTQSWVNGLTLANADLLLNNTSSYGRGLLLQGVITGTGRIVMTGTTGSYLQMDSTVVLDAGMTVVADAASSEIGSAAAAFTNKGRIEVRPGRVAGIFGNNWRNLGTVSVDQGSLVLGGTVDFNNLGTFERNGGTVTLAAAVNNVGKTIDFANTPAGVMQLGGAMITGGTITSSDGPIVITSAGTTFTGVSSVPQVAQFDGTTLAANANITAPGGLQLVNNGLTLAGSTVSLGSGAKISFTGASTVPLGGTGEIVFDGATGTIAGDNHQPVAAGVTIRTGAGSGSVSGITNRGTISARTPGGTIALSDVVNEGVIEAVNGGILDMAAPVTGAGAVRVTASTLRLGGANLTNATIAPMTLSNAKVVVTGSWNNAGATLPVDGGGRTIVLEGGGRIDGGTIAAPGGTPLEVVKSPLDNIFTGTHPATLANLVLNAPLHVNRATEVVLTNVSGAGSVSGENATVTVGTGAGNTTPITLTDNSTLNITLSGTTAPPTTPVSLTDSVASLGGTFSGDIVPWTGLSLTRSTLAVRGVLQNTGKTLDLAGPSWNWRLGRGTILGGTLRASTTASFGTGTLDGVTLDGSFETATDSVSVRHALTLNGALVKLTSIGPGSYPQFFFTPSGTLAGSGEIVLDNSSNALLDSQAPSFTIPAGITIRTGAGGTVRAWQGTITNQGTISAQTAAGRVQIYTNGGFVNQGLVEARDGASITVRPLTSYVPTALSAGGRWAVYANSAINFTSPLISLPTVTTNAADVLLSGPGSQFAAINTLSANTGTFQIDGGRDFTTAGAFTNSGAIIAGAGSTFTSTGLLTLSGGGSVGGEGTIVAAGGVGVSGSAVKPGSGTLDVGGSGLGIAAGAKLDLTTGKLIVRASGGVDVGTWDGSTYGGVTGQIQSGRHGGTWDGSGIVTTAALPNDYTTLGIATAADVLGIAGAATGTWAGRSVNAADVLAMYTYGGDANLDGVINIDDYTQIDSSVAAGGALKGWFNGDFNYDGNVDIDDYTIIDSNIDIQGAPLAGARPVGGFANAAVTPVPEPTATILGALFLPSFLLARRRCLKQ